MKKIPKFFFKRRKKEDRKKKRKIIHKLSFMLVCVTLITIIMGGIILNGNQRINSGLEELNEQKQLLSLFNQTFQKANEANVNIFQLITLGYNKAYHRNFTASIEEYAVLSTDLNEMISEDEQFKQYTVFFDDINTQYAAIYDEHLGGVFMDIEQVRKDVSPTVEKIHGDLTRIKNRILPDIEEEIALKEENLNNELQYNDLILIITLAVIVLSSPLFMILFARDLKSGMNFVKERISAYSEGDFTFTTNSKRSDEFMDIDESIEEMGNNLKELVAKNILTSEEVNKLSKEALLKSNENKEASTSVTELAHEVKNSIMDQHDNTTSISSVIEEFAATSEEVTATMNSIKDNVTNMSNISRNNTEKITEFNTYISQTSSDMSKMNQNLEKIMNGVNYISQFISQIDEITSQTNLLSLNASIESARAGEHGHGFMVVAQEVRKLSNETAKFSAEIKKIINDVQDDTNIVMDSFIDFENGFKRSEQVTSETSAAFQTILTESKTLENQSTDVELAMEEVAKGMSEISSSVDDLVSTSSNINGNVEKVFDFTEIQRDISEKLNKNVENVKRMSEELQELTKVFKI